jgi:hypothetical protein
MLLAFVILTKRVAAKSTGSLLVSGSGEVLVVDASERIGVEVAESSPATKLEFAERIAKC